MPREMDVSVILPISDHSVLSEIVHALATQIEIECTFETIVVDSVGGDFLNDFMQDVSSEEAERCRLQVYSIPVGGRGSALNEGIRRATGELYILLGDDFIPQPEWLKQHVDLHRIDPRPETVGIGPSTFPDHLLKDRFVKWLDDSAIAFGGELRSARPDSLKATWFYGANTSIKPSLIWRAGLFDDDFPYDAIEDFELGKRLFRLGMNVHYLPEAMAIHEHPVDLEERLTQYRKVGESLALYDAKYTVGKLANRQFWLKETIDGFKQQFWGISTRMTGRTDCQEQYWIQSLENSFQRGYARKWRELVRNGKPQRRLSSAFQSWMEKAIQEGQLVWKAENQKAEGLYPFLNEDGYFKSAELDGIACLSVSNPMGAPWAYFRVEPIFAQYLNQTIELECRIKAPRETHVWIEYDSTDSEVQVIPDRPGAFKATPEQEVKSGWTTCRFQLPDFCCQERINGGDFRIACRLRKGEEFHLESVKVFRQEIADKKSLRPFDWLERMGFTPVEQPRVSIIIPIHNHLLYTLQCLQSLATHTGKTSYEIIVVDDASTDLSRSTLATIPGLKLVALDTNLGFTGACNRGAEEARGELLLFLNNDIVAMPGWLDEMIAAFDAAEDAGVIGSRLIYPQTGELQHIGIGFNDQGWPYHFERDDNQSSKTLTTTKAVPAVTGACFLTPKKLFQELGAFDPVFDSECQDIDYCLKVSKAGLKSYCCGRSVLLHYESVTRKELDWEPTHDLKLLQQRWFADRKAA